MNIFIQIFSNIFQYPNICPTLSQIKSLVNHYSLLSCLICSGWTNINCVGPSFPQLCASQFPDSVMTRKHDGSWWMVQNITKQNTKKKHYKLYKYIYFSFFLFLCFAPLTFVYEYFKLKPSRNIFKFTSLHVHLVISTDLLFNQAAVTDIY